MRIAYRWNWEVLELVDYYKLVLGGFSSMYQEILIAGEKCMVYNT